MTLCFLIFLDLNKICYKYNLLSWLTCDLSSIPGKDLLTTDLQYSDTYMVLASHLLVDVHLATG